MQAAPSQYTAPISCTAESLSLQYGGYKIHVASSKKKQDCRGWNGIDENHYAIKKVVKVTKRRAKKEIKSLDIELENIKNRKEHHYT